LRDQIVDGEGAPLDPKTPVEEPPKPPGEMEKRLRNFAKFNTPSEKLDEKQDINYFGALDDIIADLYEKQGAAYKIILAVTQQFEQKGNDVPFEEERFTQICQKLSMVQASKEIAWLYGLGPEHADKVASLMIDRFFGPIPKGK
jgi:hypothetical protein